MCHVCIYTHIHTYTHTYIHYEHPWLTNNYNLKIHSSIKINKDQRLLKMAIFTFRASNIQYKYGRYCHTKQDNTKHYLNLI